MHEDDKKSDQDIADILETSVTIVHNTHKRGFNKLIDQLLRKNSELTILDVVLELMKMFDIDESIIKMLNRKNKARLAVELAKGYKLVERAKISAEDFEKYVELAKKRR